MNFFVGVLNVYIGPCFHYSIDAKFMLTFTCFFQGGLKAVIWTDVFQFAVMFTGIFAVIIKVIVPIDCTYIRDVYSYKFFF